MRPVVAVVGGGVSGLAAARVLAGGGAGAAAATLPGRPAGVPGPGEVEVLLFESSPEPGGKVVTGSVGGGPVELGPDQFLRRDPSAERLCAELGLGDRLTPPASTGAAVFSYGALRRFPPGLVLGIPTDLDALADSGAVSEEGVWRASLDATLPGPPLTEEDLGVDGGGLPDLERPAGSLLRARLGDEVVDRLCDPLLGGINAGRLDSLSLGTVAPQVARTLVGHHDVMGPLAAMARTAGEGGSPFLGLEGGLGQLVARLADDLRARGVALRTGTQVSAVVPDGSKLKLTTSGSDVEVDGVVLAVPAPVLARVVRAVAPAAGAILAGIPSATVLVVTFAYRGGEAEPPPGWSGLVVPRVEGRLTTAVTFLSQKWPWMGEGGRTVVRVSAGRSGDERAGRLDDAALVAVLRAELAALTGIDAEPEAVGVQRWAGAFPQYLPGHAARVSLVRRELAPSRRLALAGALLGGIGVPACITSGERSALELLAAIG